MDDVVAALRELRRRVRWSSDEPARLRQRVRALVQLGHLPLGATVETLAAVVGAISVDADALVYLCRGGEVDCPVLLSRVTGAPWMVRLDAGGAVATATPLADPRAYFDDERHVRLGTVRELLG